MAMITIIVVILFIFNLSAIANVAGAAFLLAYVSVFAAHWRLNSVTGGSRSLILLGAMLMIVVLVVLFGQLWQQQPAAIGLFVGVLAACLAIAWTMKRCRHEDDGLRR